MDTGKRRGGRTLRGLVMAATALVGLAACSTGNSDTVTASGVVEAEDVSVVTATGGRILSVDADVGSAVEKGQVVARLDPALLDTQVAQARAGVEAAQAGLQGLQAGARPEEQEVADAQVQLAMAQWDGARRAWVMAVAAANAASLPGSAAAAGSSKEGAQTAADQAEAAFRQAEAAVRQAQANAAGLRQGSSASDLDAARAALRQAQAALAAATSARQLADLVSPIQGRVEERLVEPGDFALPGATLLRVTDPTTTTITVYVSEDQVPTIDVGARADVTADAYPDETFAGSVKEISDQAEFTPKSVQTKDQRTILVFAVTVTVPNPTGRLKPGMTADVAISKR